MTSPFLPPESNCGRVPTQTLGWALLAHALPEPIKERQMAGGWGSLYYRLRDVCYGTFQTIDSASCSTQRKPNGRPRLISVRYDMELTDLHDVFQRVLGWAGELGYSFRIDGRSLTI
jgi:hypothetical protein